MLLCVKAYLISPSMVSNISLSDLSAEKLANIVLEKTNQINLVTNISPGRHFKSRMLKYLALDNKYSVFSKYCHFAPTRMNHLTLDKGIKNVQVVSNS